MTLTGPERPVGVVVAVREEAQAVLTRMLPLTRGRLGGFPFWRGPLARREVALIQCGPGLDRARAATNLLVERQDPRLLLSAGLCGGLAGTLAVGDVVVASRVLGADGVLEPETRSLQGARRAAKQFLEQEQFDERTGGRQERRCSEVQLVSRDRVLVTAAEKREELARSSAEAVDMESYAVAAVACERALPWLAVRVVSDTAFEDLPLDFNRFTDSKGEPQRFRILLEGLKNPRLLGHLMALEKTTRAGGKLLAEYLELLLAEMITLPL